jgi:hypothetical protein
MVARFVTGGTGFALSQGWGGALVDRKKRRMRVIAGNGLLILVPAAIVLDRLAAAGTFDPSFYLVQAVEILAGGANLTLMGLNIRDGLRLSGRLGPRPPAGPQASPTAPCSRRWTSRSARSSSSTDSRWGLTRPISCRPRGRRDAAWMKQQAGFISTQRYRAIGGSRVLINVVVWESPSTSSARSRGPVQSRLGQYPPSAVASPICSGG